MGLTLVAAAIALFPVRNLLLHLMEGDGPAHAAAFLAILLSFVILGLWAGFAVQEPLRDFLVNAFGLDETSR